MLTNFPTCSVSNRIQPFLIKAASSDIAQGDAMVAIDHQNIIGTQSNKFFGEGSKFYGDLVRLIDWAAVIAGLKNSFYPVTAGVAFADWTRNTIYQADLETSGVEMISAVDFPAKNVDFRMTAETAIRVATNPNLKRVILVAHDGDFTPLVECLRRNGRTVIGIGIRGMPVSKRLYQACDAFFKIDPPLAIPRCSSHIPA